MDTDHKCIEQLQEIGRELAQKNLVLGAAGNISVQSDEGDLYVTARGSRLGELRAEDVVKISPDGKWAPGREPTSEYLIHTFTQRAFGDVRVVVHTHSVFAVAVAVIGQNVPPIVDEMTILLGGGLDVAPYAAPGSEELARNAVKTMGDHRAVLLANHGAVVTGADPQEALKMAEMVEHVAQIFLLAKTAGKVCSIPDSVYEKQRGIYLKKRGVFFNGSFDKS